MSTIIYPQLDGVKINKDLSLPVSLIQAIRKAYDYIAQVPAATSASATESLAQSELLAFANGLNTGNTGLLVEVSDYAHILRWAGTKWQWGPGENGSGMLVPFAVNPTGVGWHACDGSAGVKYLKSDGTLGTVTLPNTNATAAYLKLAAAYASAITAATVPVVSQPTFTGTLTNTDVANTGSLETLSGASVFVTLLSHVHSYTPVGTVSQPTATLPADPIAHFAAPLWFRQ